MISSPRVRSKERKWNWKMMKKRWRSKEKKRRIRWIRKSLSRILSEVSRA